MESLQEYGSDSEGSVDGLRNSEGKGSTDTRVKEVEPFHNDQLPGDHGHRKRQRVAVGAGLSIPASVEALPQSEGMAEAHQQGRIRNVPHMAGFFRTSIYIAVLIPGDVRAAISRCIAQVQRQQPALQPLQGFTIQGGGSELQHPPHVSLSRTVYTTAQQRQTLLTALQRHFKRQKRFKMSLGGWEVFMNDQGNTGFLALGVRAGLDQLCDMIGQTDNALRLHGLETFYQPPRPHMSVACLASSAAQTQIESALSKARLIKSSPQLVQEVSEVRCLVGQKMHLVWVA
ncbi:hypothetical protein WJX74_009276 [Apatococcus lobatus]|uniref:U6 snRNA phosphodiesterase 1 n=1 Tax=Apatococcus lobatus TaxID=904363 RepID=A0AAW1RIH7_9CHLO